MIPRILSLPSKTLAGKRLSMTFVNNQTPALWRSFMPLRKTIPYTAGEDLYSVQLYQGTDVTQIMQPDLPFEKWAAVEVSDTTHLPEGMEILTIPPGLYAVFPYKGPSSAGATVFRYIFEEWLPSSAYELDNRPHFEVLGTKYRNDHPDSEEDIWIPIRPKGE